MPRRAYTAPQPQQKRRGRPPGARGRRAAIEAAERLEPASSDLQQTENGPSADQIGAALADFTELDTQEARIRQKKSTLLKNFEKAGGDTRELKDLHRSLKLEGREAQTRLERKLRYHASQGIRVRVHYESTGQGAFTDVMGGQPTPPPFRPGPDPRVVVARAHGDGFNSGKAGALPSDNPYRDRPGSEEYVSWHNGRDEGEQERLARHPEIADRLGARPDEPFPRTEAEPPAF